MLTRLPRLIAGVLCVAFAGLVACTAPETNQRGITVVEIDSPAGSASGQPHLSNTQDGRAVLSWLDHEDDSVVLRFATLDESGWQAPVTVAQGSDWFVNWADFPSVVQIKDDLWAAHWLAKREGGTYAYDVAISLSDDAGITWSVPVTPHSDNTRTEHGFVSLFPAGPGVGAVWLDGRNMAEDMAHSNGAHGAGGAMTLRSAAISAAGVTKEQVIDERVCDCCQTDVTIAASGPVVVYRDRTEAEIRDISIVSGRGEDQTEPRPIANDNWEIDGCPVNGPATDAIGSDVAVAWFTAAGGTPVVKFARSSDSGKSFGAPIEIQRGENIGRVDVVLMPDGTAYVSWLRNADDNKASVSLRSVSVGGETGPIQTIGQTGALRASGFPQLIRSDDGLVAAWADSLREPHRVRTVRIAL